MKRIVSLLLTLVLVLSISTTVFAEEGLGQGQYTGEVTGTYVEGNEGSGTVFSVDIAWEGMEFIYHAAKEPVWDAENHKYSDYMAAYWEGEGTITVTNHSNTVISAVPEFVKDSGYEKAELEFSTTKLHLASSEFMAFGANQTGTITVTADGSLPAETDGKIGVVKVTIAEDADVTVTDAQALYEKATTLCLEADDYGQTMPEGTEQEELWTMVAEMQFYRYALNDCITQWESGSVTQEELNSNYSGIRNAYYELLSMLNALKAK